jgi:hypothetical protein
MTFQILRHHFFSNIPCTPRSVPHCPKVLSPISFLDAWKFLLQQSRCSPFQSFDNIAHIQLWRILDQHMHMVFAHHAFQNHNVLSFAYLDNQFPTSYFDVSNQNMIPILRHPHNMDGQSRNTMTSRTRSIHSAILPSSYTWVATESLALKCMVSTSELGQ